jgi:hypothetical protein
MERIFIKKCSLFTVGSVCHVHIWVATVSLMTKRLKQQPKDFYAASFDALLKRWDKCINVGGGYV